MSRWSQLVALGATAALCGAPGFAFKTKTIAVDCAAGDSISKALEDKTDELIIEISGICAEEVYVTRSNVTLRGTDPTLDGIRPGPDEVSLNQALNLFGVHAVSIENLKITGGRIGLSINRSFGIDVTNCRLEDNLFFGSILGTASASVDYIDTVVTGNGSTAIWVINGSFLRCTRCTVEDNGRDGFFLSQGSELTLRDSTVEGWRALDLRGGSRVFTFGSSNTVTGLPVAIRARGTVSAELFAAAVDGRLELGQGSVLTLQPGSTHTNAGGAGVVSGGSQLIASSTSSLGGDLELRDFSQAVFPVGASISGSLSCSLGADAYCGDPPTAVGGTSDCGQCPKP